MGLYNFTVWLQISVFLCCISIAAQADNHTGIVTKPVAEGKFTLLREPSGVIAINENTFIVIEDEARYALRRLVSVGDSPATIRFEEYDEPAGKSFIQRQMLSPLDDLEGIARLSANTFLVIGSHENANRGTRPAREKSVLFTRQGDGIVSALVRRDLFVQLEKQYPELIVPMRARRKRDRQTLNIEALAFDRKRQQLHIGLRSPVLNNDSIIIRLDNVQDYLEGAAPLFADKLQRLDLNQSGIRALTYDDTTDQLFIISKRESGGKKRTRLWALPLGNFNALRRYNTEDKNLFENVEGLTAFSGSFLFVRDNGNKDSVDREDWFILQRSQLGLNE